MSTTDDATTDQTDAPDMATWDPAAWIAGATSTIRSVRLYQRADLVATADDLEEKLRQARLVATDDRSLGSGSAEGLAERLEDVYREFEASGLTVRVEGRSEASREAIDKRLKKQGVTDEAEQTLHYLAEAVVEPKGLNVEWLRTLRDKQAPQYQMVLVAYTRACSEPPMVTLPFSESGSGDPRRRRRS